MPVFTRRRAQAMLLGLAANHPQKAAEIVRRLNDKRLDQAYPAEMELGVLWALTQLGDTEIEPEWWGAFKPEAYTEHLFPNARTIVEVTTVSDNSISGEEAMDRVALQFIRCADKLERGLGSHLYFKFSEYSAWTEEGYSRSILAPKGYALSEGAAAAVENWIKTKSYTASPLLIEEPGLRVSIEKTDHKQVRYHNTFSTMPPETHRVRDNPLWGAMERKLRQLSSPHRDETLRTLFLMDGGSTLLNRLGTAGEIDSTRRRVSGREIILNFLSKYGSRVDVVIALSAGRKSSWGARGQLEWRASVFQRPGLALSLLGVEQLRQVLPKPRFEGYQVRSLFRQGTEKQGLFSPHSRGWYMPFTVSGGKDKMKIKISSRALMDLLAGRISTDQFRYLTQGPGGNNMFLMLLSRGLTISDVGFEFGGLDADDDHLVLSFKDDPAARPIAPPDNP